MPARRLFVNCAICSALGALAAGGSAGAQPAAGGGLVRNILETSDYPGNGLVTILVAADLPAGGVVARHTHPGLESTYVVAGELELAVQGQPVRSLKPGDGFQIEPRAPHGLRGGASPVRLATTYVVEKDKPLASPAPE